MEELAERISDGDAAILLISISSRSNLENFGTTFQVLIRKCLTLHIICLFEEDEVKLPSNADRLKFVHYNDSRSSDVLRKWLSEASLIFLVDISLFLSEKGTLSFNSEIILSNISRKDVSTFCLHPTSAIRGLDGSERIESNKLHQLRTILQDVSIVHMVSAYI